MKDKICFVVQRYGKEVNGGAELECMQYAEHLTPFYDVEVVTTKAIDYVTWKNEYIVDEEIINGVLVRRFPVDFERNMKKFNQLSQKILRCASSEDEEIEWMKAQGPYSTLLFNYLFQNKEKYQVFIFSTYLYCTAYFGLPLVKEKAILIPTAHDEIPIYLNIFQKLFQSPKAIFYNTKVEQQFVESKFNVSQIYNNKGLGGVGIEVPEHVSKDDFIKKYGVENFILYIGRIEEHKGCKELFQYFLEYKKRNKNNVKLVLLGKEVMNVPEDKDIISLGFVSDQDKFNALAACRFLILPSQFESLSMVVLEAMEMSRPVLVHGNCEVVKNHCLSSNGGLYYQNYFEFEGAFNFFLIHEMESVEMGKNGHQYVEKNYKWDAIVGKLRDMINFVISDEG